MAPRPPIQAVIEQQAALDTQRRNWRMVLFNEDGTPFSAGAGGGVGAWTPLTLINGWVNYDPLVPAAYRLEGNGSVVRFRGLPDGRGRANKLGDYKFAELPTELAALNTAVGLFVWRYGVGYEITKFELNSVNGLSAYINDSEAQRIGMLEGITIGL